MIVVLFVVGGLPAAGWDGVCSPSVAVAQRCGESWGGGEGGRSSSTSASERSRKSSKPGSYWSTSGWELMSTTCCVSCCFVSRLAKAVVVFVEDLFRVEADCSPVCCGVCATLALSSIFSQACARSCCGMVRVRTCGFFWTLFHNGGATCCGWLPGWYVMNTDKMERRLVAKGDSLYTGRGCR